MQSDPVIEDFDILEYFPSGLLSGLVVPVVHERRLDNPMHAAESTTNDLDRALEELTSGKPITTPVTNPLGCNVKWESQDEHWMPADACDLVLP